MASKDKGVKTTKKVASKDLKQKRQAKRDKKTPPPARTTGSTDRVAGLVRALEQMEAGGRASRCAASRVGVGEKALRSARRRRSSLSR